MSALYRFVTTLGLAGLVLFVTFRLLSVSSLAQTTSISRNYQTDWSVFYLSSLSSTASVSITETGFEPQVITISQNTTVSWTNQTDKIQQIRGGIPIYGQHLFLPIIVLDGMSSSDYDLEQIVAPERLDNLSTTSDWSNNIPPSHIFTRTFTSTGQYLYYLTTTPAFTGLINVISPTFDMTVFPITQTITQGQAITYTLSLTAKQGFAEPITLSVSSLPTGTMSYWNTNPLTPTRQTVLTLTTAFTTPVGSYPMEIEAFGGGLTRTKAITLNVLLAPPTFDMTVFPITQTITQGQAITYTLSLTAKQGFAEPITLSVSSLPTGTMSYWNTNPLTPTRQTVLTLTTAFTTPVGSYPMEIEAFGGGLTRTKAITLNVLLAPQIITDVNVFYAPPSGPGPATVVVIVSVSQSTEIHVVISGGMSQKKSCDGSCTFTFIGNLPFSGVVTVTAASGETAVAFW